MKLGDIDISNSILNLEHDMSVLQQILNHVFQNNTNLIPPSSEEIEKFKSNAISMLQKKYPNMGITKK